jgi:glyoxylase-like metal-dependent hydrolase (beta-lactamase superfamily II)
MIDSVRIGDMELTVVSGGRLALDGGNMFGVVPKVLWEGICPPDERNRIAMDTNCVLIRTPSHTVLVDTGYGTKAGEAQRSTFALTGPGLLENLAVIGIGAEDVDVVVLTHLHFDHAGGCTRLDEGGRPVPVFPRARHFVQHSEWDDAAADLPELKGSYFPADFQPLAGAGLLELVDGAAELVAGVSVRPAKGHTRGHQIVDITAGEERVVCLGDLCPMTPHLRTFWTLAYDQFPLDVRRTKPVVLEEIVRRNWLAIFSHDPRTRAARLAYGEKPGVVVQSAEL